MRVNRIFLVATALILVLGGAYIYACHSPKFNLNQITIRGNDRIAANDLESKLEPCIHKNIMSLNLHKLEGQLRQDVRLKDVHIKRRLPATLLVKVEEKSPVLWVSLPGGCSELGDCGFCGLSVDQEVIPLNRRDLSSDLPLVSGIRRSEADSRETWPPEPYQRWEQFQLQKALELYRSLTAADSGFAALLSEINLADVSNPVLYLLPNIKVIMGQGDFQRKWRRVQTILAGEKEMGSVSCLDLRFDDQVLLSRSSPGESYPRTKKDGGTLGKTVRGKHGG
jgi:cell division protein FtsQ